MPATRHENKRVARLEIARVAFGANPALGPKARFAPKACERFSARFDGRQTFVYGILKHSALFSAIRLLNLFHHNTKIPERNILCSITTTKTHATLTSPLVRIQL